MYPTLWNRVMELVRTLLVPSFRIWRFVTVSDPLGAAMFILEQRVVKGSLLSPSLRKGMQHLRMRGYVGVNHTGTSWHLERGDSYYKLCSWVEREAQRLHVDSQTYLKKKYQVTAPAAQPVSPVQLA